MLCSCSTPMAALFQGLCLLLVVRSTCAAIHIPHAPSLLGSPTIASPNMHITEAPSQEMVEKNLAKRDFSPCTQWSIVGGGQVGCSGTNTCLFTSLAGFFWEYCGDVNNSPAFVTRCHEYPTTWLGVSPTDIAYCPETAPFCGEYQFSFKGKTFFNLGCSTTEYTFLVETTPGASFPGDSATTTSASPTPPDTTSVPPSPITPTVITVPTSTTPVTPTVISSSTSTASMIPTTNSVSSAAAPTTTPQASPTTDNPPPNSTPSSSATTLSSSLPSPSPLPCSDSHWEPTPQNWFDADVDHQMAAWWTNTTAQRGSYGFVEWLARSFGDLSHSQECGIGQSCAAPDCPSFQSSGAPRWAYFAHISLMEINSLLNSMKVGMSDAETDLSLIVSDMAANFFPWKDPNTNLNHALPWILAAISSILSFIPVIGLELNTVPRGILTAVTGSAQALTAAGFQQLSTGGSDPVTHQLGTIQDLGVLIVNVTRTARDDLATWSTTLFNGGPDSTGKTIMDYMGGGRFTVAYTISETFMDNFFLQVWVSRLVNEQWQDKVNSPSKTFVMCTNRTAACDETSKYTEGSRTCCLYSIDGSANYVLPPSIEVLGNSTYNITPADITASSLHSYLAQGLSYDDSQISTTIEQSISLDNNNTFLNEGIRFQGVWTLPVCDVGLNGDWVANMAAGQMPCCCGPSCSETIQFWNDTGVLHLQGLHDKCKSQCSTCPTSAANRRAPLMRSNGVGGMYALAIFYLSILLWAGV